MNSIIAHCQQRLDSVITILQKDLAGVLDYMSVPKIIGDITFSAYGSDLYIIQNATMRVSKKQVTLDVFDKNMVKAIAKAIDETAMWLEPSVSGTLITIPIPPFSEERRLDCVRVAVKYAEQSRRSVSNIKNDMDAYFARTEEISPAEKPELEEAIARKINECLAKIDELLKDKEDILLMRI